MLYKLNDKLYIMTNSYYVEVILEDKGDDIVLSPTNNKTVRRLLDGEDFKQVTFEDEKRKFKEKKEAKKKASEDKKHDYSKFIK